MGGIGADERGEFLKSRAAKWIYSGINQLSGIYVALRSPRCRAGLVLAKGSIAAVRNSIGQGCFFFANGSGF